MKVVLTENQMRTLLREEVIMESFFYEGMSFRDILETVKLLAKKRVLTTALVATIAYHFGLNQGQRQVLQQQVPQTEQVDVQKQKEYEAATSELHQAKVQELERCMKDKYLRLKGRKAYNPKDIVLSAEEMVSACEEHNYDLILAAAQAWNESAWGTTPRAKRTNSVFSVGAYDNGKDAVKYDTINASIRPYIKLMQNDYGITPDSMNDIFNGKKNLVNGLGKRYASNDAYEENLKATYDSIKKNYPILSWDVETWMANKKENS